MAFSTELPFVFPVTGLTRPLLDHSAPDIA